MTDLFFSSDPAVQAAAKALCAGCPVRQDCYLAGVEAHTLHGPSIWGGCLFPSEYRRLRRFEARVRLQPGGFADPEAA